MIKESNEQEKTLPEWYLKLKDKYNGDEIRKEKKIS